MKEKTSNNSNAVINPVAIVRLGDYEAELREDDLRFLKNHLSDEELIPYINDIIKAFVEWASNYPCDEGEALANVSLLLQVTDWMRRLSKFNIKYIGKTVQP